MNERIKLIRTNLKLSQKDFGERIGLKSNSISDIENGKNELREQVLKAVCREYNVNENWIRYGEGDMFDTLSDEEEMMAHIGSICSDDDVRKQRVLEVVVKVIDNNVCWEIINNEIEKIINASKKE